MTRKLLPYFCLFLLWTLTHCKAKDREDPALVLTQPAAPFAAQASQRINISGTASDNLELSVLNLSLRSVPALLPIETHAVTLTGAESTFAFDFSLGDQYTPSGDYELFFQVTDAAGNTHVQQIPIGLTEVPRTFVGMYFLGTNSGGEDFLFFLNDSTGVVEPLGKLGQGGSTLLADPVSRHLYYASAQTGQLQGRSLDEPGTVLFDDLVSNGGGGTAFTGLAVSGQELVASLGLPPYGRIYRSNGNFLRSLNDLDYPAPALTTLGSGSKMAIAQVNPAATVRRVDTYDYNSSAHFNSANLNWTPAFLAETAEGKLVAAGTDANGKGILVRFNAQLQVDLTRTFDEAVRGVVEALALNQLFVLTEAGIFALTGADLLQGNNLHAGDFHSLAFEQVSQQLYLGGLNEIKQLNASGLLLKTVQGNFGLIHFLTPYNNK